MSNRIGLDMVGLTPLMDRTCGKPDVIVGLIDGPVALDHPDLAAGNIRNIGGKNGACAPRSSACLHGVFVAGILSGRRGSVSPAICPDCTILARPIFSANDGAPTATPGELAKAILDCIEAGARVLNISAALVQPTIKNELSLKTALDHAARRSVIVVAAAGNQGSVGGAFHPWVIPVISYDLRGRPMNHSNLGNTIGRRGLGAPGAGITSLGGDGPLTLSGTSAATPFVTGAVALLWSEFPTLRATEIKYAITQAYATRRTIVVPPLLDAWASFQFLRR